MKKRFAGLAVFLAIGLLLVLTGCSSPTGGNSDPTLPGTITIGGFTNEAKVGDTLTANYSGTEIVSYQ